MESHEQKQKEIKKKKNGFISGFAGGVCGGILTLMIGGGLFFSMNQQTARTSNATTAESTTQVNEDGKVATVPSVVASTELNKTIDSVKNSVVSIINFQPSSSNYSTGITMDNADKKSGELTKRSEGSGVIYKKDKDLAYIVTNNHVIQDASNLQVLLADGSVEEAKVVGSDRWTDIAVITIPADKVTQVAKFADSDTINVGDTALAIGSPLGAEFATSVTQGIVSAKDRAVDTDIDEDGTYDWTMDAIQTDAAINPGNSGGALINAAGQIIGINSMKISNSAVEGMGFAIPSNQVVELINQLEKNGKIIRPFLGIGMYNREGVSDSLALRYGISRSVKEGVIITQVESGSDAEKAGLEAYDVLTKVDGKDVKSVQAFRKVLYSHHVGEKIELTFYRGDKEMTVSVELTHSNNLEE